MLKRSENINLDTFQLSSDIDYSDTLTDDDFDNDREDKTNEIITAPLDHFTQLFKVQDFKHTKSSRLPQFTDTDYNIDALSNINIPKFPQKIQSIDCLYIMCAQPKLSAEYDETIHNKLPTLFMWKNMKSVLPGNFSNEVQNYFHERYERLKCPIRYFFQVSPSAEKLNLAKSIRKDIQRGRILFHYIGNWFPVINENIYSYDNSTCSFENYSIKNLFENIKAPSWFIFDCANAEAALIALQKTAEAHIRMKAESCNWNDWICFCATSINEKLPNDPHLPKDFLTSCLLTPTKTAMLCHMLQYYRTQLIHDDWEMSDLESRLLCYEVKGKLTELHEFLNHVLETITDAIAAESLHFDIYYKMFRTDGITTKLFQRFLLAQFLLRRYQIHPVSYPFLPNMAIHCLWQQWNSTLDAVILSSTSNCFLNDLFSRAYASFSNLKKSKLHNDIPLSFLTIISHPPKETEERSKSFRLLASFAAESALNREKIAKYVDFNPLFHQLLSIDDPSTIHSIAYLILIMLSENCSFAALQPTLDVTRLCSLIFSDNLKEETKAIIVAIISTIIPNNDQIRQYTSSNDFAMNIKALMETSGAELSLWLLILQRRILDGLIIDIPSFFNSGIHIQTGSFCLHFSPEVRAAAISTLFSLLQPNQDIANMHLFGLAMLCGFDGSYTVRYNFVMFLSKFLSIYSDKIIGHVPIGLLAHQLFGCVVATWSGIESSDLVSLGEILSNFDELCNLITQIMRYNDAVQRFVGIGLFLADYLSNDPHPSVKKAATKLAKLNIIIAGLKHKLATSKNQMSVPMLASSLSPEIGSLPVKQARRGTEAMELNEDDDIDQNQAENGGDLLYISCMNQLVRSGCWRENEFVKVAPRHSKTTKVFPSEKFACRNKYNQQPTSIAYDYMSRKCAIGFSNGSLRFISDENDNAFSEIQLTSRITSLEITTVNSQTCIIAGTDDGCCHIWNGSSSFPQQSFRTDGLPQTKVPQLVSVLNNEPFVLTARGNCGSLKLWDIRAQKLVNEWVATQNNKDNIITAMCVDPVTSQCYLGHSTGLIALVDVRSEKIQKIPDFNSCGVTERIITIKGNVSSTKQIYAATEKGNISVWSNFKTSILPFIKLDCDLLSSIDFHKTQPLIALSTTHSFPTIISKEGKMISLLKECGVSSLVGFHPSLPIVGACTKDGSFFEYDLSSYI